MRSKPTPGKRGNTGTPSESASSPTAAERARQRAVARPVTAADDAAAFAEAVRGTRELGGVRRVPATATGAPPAPRSSVGSAALSGGAFRRAHALGGQAALAVPALPPPGAPVGPTVQPGSTGETWSARADGVDARVSRKLRAGHLPVEAELDLHGLTRAPAVAALDRFLAEARRVGQRCLLVIHGRGLHSGAEGAALREVVRAALLTGNHAGVVLACGTAPPARGGAGATLVLLRR